MKAVGIIVEYNPFTNGHLYHLKQTKLLTNADVVIAIMSSSFVQRGEPAIISKEERVRMALEAGIDLVVELPFLYSVQNADFFAFGALNILSSLGVETIVFGSETGNTKDFLAKYDSSSIIQPHLDFLIKDYINEGLSYPVAFNKALKEIDCFQLETPNDILGFAYQNVIIKNNLPLKIETIKREQDYKDDTLKEMASASSLRKALKEGKSIQGYTPFPNLENLHFLEDYFSLLKHLLITSSPKQLASLHLVEEGVEYLFKKKILESNNMSDFIQKCVSKRYTVARIKRIIIHILVQTDKEEVKKYLREKPPYARILGINKKGEEYLKDKRKDITIPVLSRFEGKKYPLLNLERKATFLYFYNHKNQDEEYEKELYLYPIRKKD